MNVLVITEAIVIALLVILVAGLLRSHAEILRRLHALDGGEDATDRPTRSAQQLQPRPRGSEVPATVIAGQSPTGSTISLPLSATRGLTALAFMSSTCSGCKPFWRSFREGVDLPHDEMRLVVVTKGPEEESPAAIDELATNTTTVVMSTQAWDDFGVPASPFFVLIDASTGRVLGEGSGPSWRRIVRMLADAIGDERATQSFGRNQSTSDRLGDTDEVLRHHGITADDPSLWSDPVQDIQP